MRRLLISILVICSITAYAGGGWVHSKGKGYFKLSQSVISADRFFAPNGKIVDITTISLYTTSFYGEYGLTDRWTAIAYVPFFVRSTLNEKQYNQSGRVEAGDALNAFGDTNIGIKYGLIQNKSIVLAASLTFGLPLGETAGGKSKILQTGDGEFNQILRLDASHSFYPLPFYASVYTAFNNRTNGFSDEFHYGGEIGYTFFSKLNAAIKVNSVNSLYNGGASDPPLGGVFSNNTEYFSYGPEIAFSPNQKFGIAVNAGFASSGRRILAAPNLSAGFYLTL